MKAHASAYNSLQLFSRLVFTSSPGGFEELLTLTASAIHTSEREID